MTQYNLTWGGNTPVTQRRLGELVLYIANKTADLADFGSMKLNKTLYHSDSDAFRDTGKSITGAQYHRIQNGPVPKHILVVERNLENEEALEIKVVGKTHCRLAKREADTSMFSDDELARVDDHIERLKGMTFDEVSDDSHDIRWHALTHQALVPYEFAFLSDDVTDKDRADATALADQFGW